MRRLPPPYRLVALVIGGWACGRAAALMPPWWAEPPAAPASRAAPLPLPSTVRLALRDAAASASAAPVSRVGPRLFELERRGHSSPQPAGSTAPAAAVPYAAAILPDQANGPFTPEPGAIPALLAKPVLLGRGASRWSGYAYGFLRRGGAASLATQGTLGGSQFGGRLSYRLNGDADRPLAVSARISAAGRRLSGADAALGLDWKPLARVPLHVVAERRQALGRDGRSGFALSVYGGIGERRVLGDLRFDGFGQAGVVGMRSRDLFADGMVRLSLPLGGASGRVRMGAGMWGAAQPGAARLDIGPHASLRLPVSGSAEVSLGLDWRLRAAGDAAPGSGPALTLSTAF